MPFPRSSGLLLHPTSLPGPFGIGDLGQEAYYFVDFLQESAQQLWQVLPLGPTGYGNSPYMCYSAMAGNPLLISLEVLRDQGFLTSADLENLPEFPADKVAFEQVAQTKMPLLRQACSNFLSKASASQQQEFQQFCQRKAQWLDNYAFFMALKKTHNGTAWNTWEPEIAWRQPSVMQQWRQQLEAEIFLHKFWQFEFFRQWSQLKHYANQRGIQIIGDIPIYVAHDSADVWAHPADFELDEATGEPALMAGVPPDYFSETGQLWGNPIYNWKRMKQHRFPWWLQRFRAMLDYVDLIRVDHFRGFQGYWQVKQGETTALNGEWVEAPGEALFEVILQELGTLPILAEDLGVITPDVEALRDKFEFPGMKILQFAFGSGPGNPYLPFNYSRNCLVYTGTHDNDTTVGWFNQLPPQVQESVVEYLGCLSSAGVHWDLIRLALSSIANQAIIPLQDVLGLGTEARMNYPSKPTGNWAWRYPAGALTDEVRDRLKHLTQCYGRAPY
jgi:4-alpha-glucanotransferase